MNFLPGSPRLQLLVAFLVAAVLAFSLGLPWLKTPVLLALSNGLAVTGVIVLIRAGQVSFGHAMFACLSGYGVAFIGRAWHLDALLLIALGTAAAALAGALIGVFMVRYRGIFFGMLNLAFSMVLFSVLGKFGAFTGGTDGLRFDRPSFGFVHLEREGFETALLLLALVLAVLAGEVHSGVEVRKRHTYRLAAFGSGDAGPIAHVEEGRLRLHRPWPNSEAVGVDRLPEDVARWPRVEIVTSHAGAGAAIVAALRQTGVHGIVVACTGNGSVHHDLEVALLEAQAAGVRVIRSSRCLEGAVIASAGQVLPSAGALTPVQARVEMVLALLGAGPR